jgi:hypothetical protein
LYIQPVAKQVLIIFSYHYHLVTEDSPERSVQDATERI